MSDDNQALPFKPALERAVLGAAIRSAEAREKVFGALTQADFYTTDGQAVYAAVTAADAAGDVDPLMLGSTLEDSGVNDAYSLVHSLVSEASLLTAVEGHIGGIKAASQARQVHQRFTGLARMAVSTAGSPDEVRALLTSADDTLRELTESMVTADWKTITDLAQSLDERGFAEPVMPTGFLDLDRRLGGGLRAGQMVIIAARPGFGKSTLAMDFCRHAAIEKDVPGLFISLEMQGPELAARLLAAESGVANQSIRNNKVGESEQDALDRAVQRVIGAPLYFVDNIAGHWPTIQALIASAVRRLGIKFVVIDYLQLIDSDGTTNPSREQQISKISRGFKIMTKKFALTGIAVAQLNRGPENRGDNRPKKSDLRESGSLEQDADVVLLLHQPALVNPISDRVGEADLIVDKIRDGEPGTITLSFQGAYSRFQSFMAEPTSAA